MRKTMKLIFALYLLLFTSHSFAKPIGDCDGTPNDAVTELPSPINIWGQIVCTPYGHIISNMEGYIWSNLGSYSPVMIPSQMIRSKPEKLGNKSYFKEITLTKLTGAEASKAISIFEEGFDKSETTPKVYSLKVVSVSGKELSFQFFEFENNHWGMWCNKICNPKSRFMILNMNKKPNNAINLDS